MPGKKKSTYFTHKIPQSEYRNLKEKTEEDRTKIDTDIPELNIKNDSVKTALKEKIQAELLPIFTNFFPDDNHTKVLEGPFLNRLYKKLGL